MPEPRVLINAVEASPWTGRPIGTIRRWAFEGRITRHGKGRGHVFFDVRELPTKTLDPAGGIILGAVPGLPERDALQS